MNFVKNKHKYSFTDEGYHLVKNKHKYSFSDFSDVESAKPFIIL